MTALIFKMVIKYIIGSYKKIPLKPRNHSEEKHINMW